MKISSVSLSADVRRSFDGAASVCPGHMEEDEDTASAMFKKHFSSSLFAERINIIPSIFWLPQKNVKSARRGLDQVSSPSLSSFSLTDGEVSVAVVDVVAVGRGKNFEALRRREKRENMCKSRELIALFAY